MARKVRIKFDGLFPKGGVPLSGTAYEPSFWKDNLADPCVYCGGKSDTREHVIPLHVGGDRGNWNCVRACSVCNRERSSKPLLTFLLSLRTT